MLPLVPYSVQTGPFLRPTECPDGYVRNYVKYSRFQVGSRQKRPYTVPTSYVSREYKLLSGYTDCDSWNWVATGNADVARNRARERLVNKLGDKASFGATLTAEARESYGLVVGGITALANAANCIRRGRLAEAASLLGLPYREKLVKRTHYRYEVVSRKNGLGRQRVRHRVTSYQRKFDWGTGRLHVKSAANGWLMWSYGASPMITDVHTAMAALTSELPSKLIVGVGRDTVTWRKPFSSSAFTVFDAKIRVKSQCYVRVSNPNLWLANQLGLVNPVQWVNEAIPFSFVLDWVSNLSQVISQMTDFVGLDVLDPCTVEICEGRETLYPLVVGPWPYSKQHTVITRSLGLPSVTLQFAYERFSWQRGLNAISLLVGFLPKK